MRASIGGSVGIYSMWTLSDLLLESAIDASVLGGGDSHHRRVKRAGGWRVGNYSDRSPNLLGQDIVWRLRPERNAYRRKSPGVFRNLLRTARTRLSGIATVGKVW